MDEHHSASDSESPVTSSWGRRNRIKWEHEQPHDLNQLSDREAHNRGVNLMEDKSANLTTTKYKNMARVKRKGNWSEKEDHLLLEWVEVHGPNKWTECARRIEGRCGKQCRERWMNTLDPRVKRGNWEELEQTSIFEQMQLNWTSWAVVAKALPGRTENAVKNYFYSSIRRLRQTDLYSFLQVLLFCREFRARGKDF